MLSLKMVHANDPKVTQSMQNVRTVLNSAQDDIDGCLQGNQVIAGISFPTPGVDVVVTHKLGRAPVGYLMTTANAPAGLYTSPTNNPSPTTQLILRSSATGAVTASILVF